MNISSLPLLLWWKYFFPVIHLCMYLLHTFQTFAFHILQFLNISLYPYSSFQLICIYLFIVLYVLYSELSYYFLSSCYLSLANIFRYIFFYHIRFLMYKIILVFLRFFSIKVFTTSSSNILRGCFWEKVFDHLHQGK